MIDKPERYDPYRLPGQVDFLYDGKSVSAQETLRGIVDEEQGRILVRDRQRERDLAASLASRGIRPMEGWQAEKYSIWIPAQKMPEAVESLVAEGWIVEAQGYHVRRAGTWRMNVTSGVDWFDLDGTLDFDGMQVRLPEVLEALRQGQNYVRLKDGSRGILPQQWLARFASMAELGEAEGEAIRFRSSQALLLDACWRPRTRSRSMPPSRSSARNSARSTASARPASRRASRASCGNIRRQGWAGCTSCAISAWAAAWPTTWAWARRSRCWPCCRSGARGPPTARAAVRLRWPSCPGASCSTGSRRPSVSRPSCGSWTTPACSELADNFDQNDLVITTYGTHAAGHRQAQGHPLRLCHPGRVAGDQELPFAAGQGLPAAEGRPPPGHDRHPRQKPPGRALVAAGVSQPGHARPASVFQDISKKVTEDSEGLSLLRRALGPFILRRTSRC